MIWSSITALLVVVGLQDQQDNDIVPFVIKCIEANLSAPRSGIFKFEVVIGRADSHDAAERLKISDQSVAKGSYAFDTNNLYYERIYNKADILKNATKLSSTQVVRLIDNVRILSNRVSTCVESTIPNRVLSDLTSRVDIFSDTNQDLIQSRTDFIMNYGMNTSKNRLLTHLLGIANETVNLIKNEQNGDLLSLDFEVNNKFVYKYTINIALGCIPVRTEISSANGKVLNVTTMNDIVKINDVFYPKFMTNYSVTNKVAKVVVISKLDTDCQVDSSFFAMAFPKKTTIHNADDKTSIKNVDRFSFKVGRNSLVHRGNGMSSGTDKVVKANSASKLKSSSPVEKQSSPKTSYSQTASIVFIGVVTITAVVITRRSLKPKRAGFTIVELVVAISLFCLLLGILIPAVLSARAASRSAQCRNNLRQIGIALNNYLAVNELYPPINSRTIDPGIPALKHASAHSFSVHTRLLPHLEYQHVFNNVNLTLIPDFAPGLKANSTAMNITISTFVCPSDNVFSPAGYGRVNYKASIGASVFYTPSSQQTEALNGPFTVGQCYGPASFANGLSNVVGFSESLQGNWSMGSIQNERNYALLNETMLIREPSLETIKLMSRDIPSTAIFEARKGETWFVSGMHNTNYNHAMPPNSDFADLAFDSGSRSLHVRSMHSGSFSARSYHSDGVHVLNMDGSVQFTTNSIDPTVWERRSFRNPKTW